MLTRRENELLTAVGKGTPGGEMLRRYWYPLAPIVELEEKPTKKIRLLGEDLVLFKLPSGQYGLLGERCSHRLVSLYYGFLEDDGLRCAYHGWKYDVEGRCLEQPFEPPGSTYKDSIRQPAYKVERFAGLLWGYLGPDPVPLIPHWEWLVSTDGTRDIELTAVLNCNWVQTMENVADTVHTYYLHGRMSESKGVTKGARYYDRPIEKYEYLPFEWGILKRRYYGGDKPEVEKGHPLLFPNLVVVPTEEGRILLDWRIPIDDHHTTCVRVSFYPTADGEDSGQAEEDVPVVHSPPFTDENGEYSMLTVQVQDAMAFETAGSIVDRTKEHLGASDRGVAMFRRLLREQIAIVHAGEDPIGVIRDANRQIIQMELSEGQLRRGWVAQDAP